MPAPSVAIVYHSGYGHTAVLAKSVADGAAASGAKTHLVPVEEVDSHWDLLNGADAIVFGAPTYMGSLSAAFKTFMEKSSKVWGGQGWKDKLAAGFTNSASPSGDKLNALVELSIYAAQHGMVWVGLGLMPGNNSSTTTDEALNRLGSFLGVMAQSNADQGPDLAPPQSDRRTAEHLGRRVAEAALRWAKVPVTA